MKKLLLFIALVWVYTASICAQNFTYNGINYAVNGTGTVAVTSLANGAGGNVVIPATVPYNNATYSVAKVNPWAFTSNPVITSLDVNAKMVDHEAFQLCPNLTSVIIGDNVASVGYWSFRACPKLTSITIGTGLTDIATSAFAENSSLTTFNIAAGNPTFFTENGVLFDKNKTIIFAYPAGKPEKSYIIPNSVQIIYGAFTGAKNLTEVTIPASVSSINSESFNYCANLTKLYCYATTPPVVSLSNVFVGLNAACKLYVPAGTVEKYKAAAGWSVFFSGNNIEELPSNGIDENFAGDPVVSTLYYSFSGKKVQQPQQGKLYVVKELRQSGKETVRKELKMKN